MRARSGAIRSAVSTYADARAKSKGPPERIDEQAEIAGIADDTIDAARDQFVAGLDGDQPAEPPSEHKDRPEPQHPAGGEKHDAEPADGLPVEGPEPLSVCVSRQIGGEHPDQTEGDDDPAVGPILAHSRAQISFTEEGHGGHHEEHDREDNQSRVGEEEGKPARAEDREPEIGKGPHKGER